MELDRNAIIDRVQSKTTTIDEFNFDKLIAPPLCSLLSMEDIDKLYYIATSVKYSGNARKKYKAIDDILKPRGFTKLGSGTNRVVYKFLEDSRFVLKIAVDAVGIKDNPKEFINQNIYKPFVTKVFEVDPSGVVAVVERVNPITSREEFLSIADDVFAVINEWFLGKYVMADIGTKFFMNWSTRTGFGPVLLDFPYVYELDGNKLYCSAPDNNSETGLCGGEIDYDDGFNFLHCTKCGAQYRVRELAKAIKEETVMVKGNRRKSTMKVAVRRNGVTISTAEETLGQEVAKIEKRSVVESRPTGSLKVSIKGKSEPKSQQGNKPYNNGYKKNNHHQKSNNYSNGGNNRGVVRDTTQQHSTATPEKKEFEEPVMMPTYTTEQLAGKTFEFSSHDAENDLLILKTEDDVKICLDLTTIDKEVYDIFFEQSDYMLELENTKKDLIAKEEALEAEKEGNASLSDQLDVANKGVEDLQKTIDIIDEQLKNKDAEIEKLQALVDECKTTDEASTRENETLLEQLKEKDDKIMSLQRLLDQANSVEKTEDEPMETSDDIGEPDEDETSVPISLVKEKDDEIDQLNKTILEMTEEITKLSTEASKKSDDEITSEKLKKDLEREKAKVASTKEDYEAKMKALEDMLQKSNETIDSLMSDESLPEVPLVASSKGIDFDKFTGFSCIHGVTTSFNQILDTINADKDLKYTTFGDDHTVIVFPDGNGGFIKDVDDNTIVAVSVNNVVLDDLKIVGRDHYDSSMKRYEALKKMRNTKPTPVGVNQK